MLRCSLKVRVWHDWLTNIHILIQVNCAEVSTSHISWYSLSLQGRITCSERTKIWGLVGIWCDKKCKNNNWTPFGTRCAGKLSKKASHVGVIQDTGRSYPRRFIKKKGDISCIRNSRSIWTWSYFRIASWKNPHNKTCSSPPRRISRHNVIQIISRRPRPRPCIL